MGVKHAPRNPIVLREKGGDKIIQIFIVVVMIWRAGVGYILFATNSFNINVLNYWTY